MNEYTLTNKTFNKVTGDSGEQLAKEYLKKNGFQILKTNYKTNIGEIDIIAKQKDFVVFVEVKTRKNDYFVLIMTDRYKTAIAQQLKGLGFHENQEYCIYNRFRELL